MDEFDKEFDAAPEAVFDDEFEQAQAAPTMLDNALSAVTPSQSTQDMLLSLPQTGQDFAQGVAGGLSMNSLDELGGALGAGIETGLGALGIGPAAVDAQLQEQGFSVPGTDLTDRYRDYQQGIEQQLQAGSERSPVAETVGQIAGGVTGGMALGGLLGVGKGVANAETLSQIARNQGTSKAALELLKRGGAGYAKASPAIAAEAALTSNEQLIGDNANPAGVAGDVAGGLAFGLPAMIGLEGASQAVAPSIRNKVDRVSKVVSDAFQDEANPRLRQLAKSYKEYGQKLEIHPRDHGQDINGAKLSQRDQSAASTMLKTFNEADDNLGKDVGNSIERATTRGALVDISPDIATAAQRVSDLATQIPDLGSSRKSASAFDKILNRQSQLTPRELKNLIDDLDSSIGVFKASTNKDPAAVGTLNELMRYRQSVSQTLKDSVPEYAQAAERFESFRNVLEQLISGDRPADVSNLFYGSLKNQDQKVYDKLVDMIQNVQKTGESSQSHRTAFTNFMDALENFQSKETSNLASDASKKQVLPDPGQIRSFLLDASDDSVLRGSVRNTMESRGVMPDVKEWLIGKAPASGAYLTGRATKKLSKIVDSPTAQKVAYTARSVFNAPKASVEALATRLENSGQFQSVGKALREAMQNGDSAKKNAALFTIMQNPNARAFISAEDFPDDDRTENDTEE